ncbi:IS3 family transposase [Janibacter melonis]|uniref:IS3 family transposase n=1 Tax=Janibacter melonis TaxID=262209 RepID=UPI003556F742
MAEALNSLFKAECIRNPVMRPTGGWKSVGNVEIAVAEYVDWFNHRRLHGEIGLAPPAEFEANHWASQPVEHYRQNPVLTEVGSNQPSLHQTRDASMSCQAAGASTSGPGWVAARVRKICRPT